jgi:hypothetical protein
MDERYNGCNSCVVYGCRDPNYLFFQVLFLLQRLRLFCDLGLSGPLEGRLGGREGWGEK